MKLTFYGHSCIGIQTGDAHLLFDPFISGNPLAENIDIDSVPATHVLLSHGHGDHVADAEAILKRTGAMLISNAEICDWYAAKGIKRSTPMNIGGETDLGSFRVRFTMAQHSSTMPDGASGGDPGGFVILTGEGNIHHAGDTGLMLDMQLLKRHALRFACLPIGDNYTMGFADAVEAAKFMGVDTVVGMHYNTFPAITIDLEAAKAAFASANIQLLLPAIGETIKP
ncbi:MAG: metal-dependent hydrolase [Flavobacteriales bacterium]|jgi:L-ascorbate metabolism protein UlaG (beta-lactamase superfamily)|nr:metal-dependent hydrolase [Flavobacteriales bacterium]MCB0758202.1 metal-dependent hydrolase [Flavobacteriales bacterium]